MSNVSKPAYSNKYLTREIATERLGLSKRRLLELASTGKIRRQSVIDPGTNREQFVFLAADVNRIANGLATTSANVPGPAARPATDVRLARPQLALPPIEAPMRLWMTAAEAEEYSGLPARFIVELVESGRLPALNVGVRPGGRWRIKRNDIDDLRGVKQR